MRTILVLMIVLAFVAGLVTAFELTANAERSAAAAASSAQVATKQQPTAEAPSDAAASAGAIAGAPPGGRDDTRPGEQDAGGEPGEAATDDAGESTPAGDVVQLEAPAQGAPTDPANAAFWYYSLGELFDDAPPELQAALEQGATGDLAELELSYQEEWDDVLDATDQAIECEECVWPGFENGGDFLIQLPYLSWLQWAGFALGADAWRLYGQGRSLDAITRFDAIFALALDLESNGVLVSALVAGRIRRTAMDSMRRLLVAADDPDLYWRAIELLARQEAARRPLADSLARETLLARNTVESLIRGDAATRQLIAGAGVVVSDDPESLEQLRPQLDLLTAHLHEVETQMRLPLRQALPIIEVLEQRIQDAAGDAPLIQALAPNLLPLVLAEADALGRMRGMRVWCGVQLHRLLTGELPRDLRPVAALLSGLPNDPLTNAPPGYKRWNETDAFSLWMVGRNLVDDGCSDQLDLVINADR